ncbi:MAG: N-acetylgalactosamine 6-sulfate sulfatase [Planctomycetota bacterium]|nr:MAG: N-acetylgalactosamine 6-sulfate sulfatase [Planctomycetota bacterium]
MRTVFSLLFAAALCSVFAGATSRAAERPNVVIILSDDQGWGDLSVHGNTNIATPAVDSLARDGALFERFYVCPVCSPTRAELLTGRYHPRCGVWSTSRGGERLDLDEKTIGDTFKAAGYATGAFGKWHNGTQWPYHPNARGFDEYYGFCSGHWGLYFNPVLEHNGRTVRGRGYITDDLTDHAIAFIEEHKDEPFFCYVPYNTPHSPMQVPEKFFDKFDGRDLKLRHRDPEREDLQMTRAALAMCENIDWNVGRVLKKLDELELADDTIVLYFCDNGPNSYRFNGDMKGRKGSTDEGGVRSPLLVRWPGHIQPGTKVEASAAAIDLLPTLAALADIPVASDKPLDGTSVAGLLTGQSKELPERTIYSHWNGKVSARFGPYRLDHTGKLFDLSSDPGQRNDLSKQQPELVKKLRREVSDWRRDVLGELLREESDDRPFTVGYNRSRPTPLPARDGEPGGGVERSSRAPNCSFFTHWTSPEDAITWDIDVQTPGTYEAVVYYTCPEADLGSTVELSFGGKKASAKVTEAHDPPLVGEALDLVDRNHESYVKDFAPLKLGTIELKSGRGPLVLRATEVPGSHVMDVRGVMLTPVE